MGSDQRCAIALGLAQSIPEPVRRQREFRYLNGRLSRGRDLARFGHTGRLDAAPGGFHRRRLDEQPRSHLSSPAQLMTIWIGGKRFVSPGQSGVLVDSIE